MVRYLCACITVFLVVMNGTIWIMQWLAKYFCNINENEHKNEINEYKRDFHLFNVYYYAPSHSLTLTKSNTHTHAKYISFACASFYQNPLYCISCKVYDGKMHTKGPLMQAKNHKNWTTEIWMSKSFNETWYVLYTQ